MNSTPDTAVLGAEPGATFYVRSGSGVYVFHLGRTSMSLLRQSAEGLLLIATVTSIDDEEICKVDTAPWSGGERNAIVREVIGVLEAVTEDHAAQITRNQGSVLKQLAAHLNGIIS